MNTWEQWEAKTQSLLAAKEWEACIQHINAISPKDRKDTRYIRSLERACQKLLAVPAYQHHAALLRKAAYTYYDACFENHALVLHHDKQYCKTQAAHYFSLLLQQERRPLDTYRYAQLLYCSSNDFFSREPLATKRHLREKAYDLYEETIQTIEKEKADAYTALYNQACYALGRCGLELISSYSVLLHEISLVADVPLPFFGNKEIYKTRLQRVHACLDTLRAIKQLPRQIKNTADIKQISQNQDKAEHIYYLLGKAFDYAWQFGLCENKILARQWAERYYTYACEIHYYKMKYAQRIKPFFHMYIALANVYIRQKDKKSCIKIWKRYQLSRYIPLGYQRITAIRWAIVEKKYEKARQIITAYQNKKDWQEGLSPQRTAACRHIVDALQGTFKMEENQPYSGSQLKVLLKLTKRCQPVPKQ